MDHVWGKLPGNEADGLSSACLRLQASGVVLRVGFFSFLEPSRELHSAPRACAHEPTPNINKKVLRGACQFCRFVFVVYFILHTRLESRPDIGSVNQSWVRDLLLIVGFNKSLDRSDGFVNRLLPKARGQKTSHKSGDSP